jgi:5-formyltetrahydrofolate cyclo-ligase
LTDGPELSGRKAEARRLARAKRVASVDPVAARALIAHFPMDLATAGVIAGYWPLGSEIDSRPLLAALAAAGASIALPHIAQRTGPTLFRRWQAGDRLVADAFGIMAPDAGEAVEPAVILTPLLAFDRQGGRLGQGGGHYDRVLAALKPKGAIAVGLAYAVQELAAIPAEPHDQRLDWIVTEKEAIRVR